MDQLGHMIRHAAQQGGDVVPFRYGHISVYDDKLHRVRCIIPSMNDEDGNPLLSPWMPLGTLSAGAGSGIQVFYEGGATIDNPTAGEQVLIATFDRQRGVSAVPTVFFHSNNLPPSTNLPTTSDGYSGGADPSVPGDIMISTASATEGGANTFIRLRKDGTVQIWSAGQMSANIIGGLSAVVNTGDVDLSVAQGNVTANVAAGDVTVTASGIVSIFASAIHLASAAGAAIQQLCNTAFSALYNGHNHHAPNGDTGPPLQQSTETELTQIVRAE